MAAGKIGEQGEGKRPAVGPVRYEEANTILGIGSTLGTAHYNHLRHYESIGNLTPATVY